MQNFATFTAAAGAIGLCLLAGGTAAQDWALPADGATPPATLPPLRELDPASQLDLRKAVEVAGARFQRINARQPDLESQVIDLALDPRAAFALIRDEVASVPYAGQLRDAEDVLIARAGNAHDKAAALGEILSRMGYDTRLVRADSAQPVSGADVCRARAGGDADVFLLAALGEDVLDRVSARARASYHALLPHLGEAEAPKMQEVPGHVWLQVRDGADWVDLDPWQRTASWGEAPAGPGAPLAEPVAPQQVELRLIVETLDRGRLRETEVMQERFDLPGASEQQISLSFGPKADGTGGILSETLQGLQGIAAPMNAVLTVNGEARRSRVFAAPGVPGADTLLSDAETAPVTTAIWLDLRSVVSGGAEDRERRYVIDLIPQEMRAAHAGGAELNEDDILPPVAGDRFPAELESLRHIVISNGGLSRRLAAARGVQDLLDLPELLRRTRSGQPDVEALLWTTWLQARRFALVSEELLSARPGHDGGCVRPDRPRVAIWGIKNAGGDARVQWIDWALDGVGIHGAAPQDAARMRLWHGALQSALETEALLRVTLAPPDHAPLDQAPLDPLASGAAEVAGRERADDAARGFVTLAGAATQPGAWWRVDPASGRADARIRDFGNSGYYNPWSNYVNASRGGIVHISEQELALLERDLARWGSQGFADEMGRLHDVQNAERASRQRRGPGGNEYTIILFNVSIPASVAVGTTVGVIVIGGLLVALYG